MATPTNTDLIQMLYVAYFDRPADPAGLAYWQGVLATNGGDISVIASAFSATAEYTAAFKGLSNDAIVNEIYHNLFNRAPDLAGLNYWSGNLTSGALTVANIVEDIALSAVNSTVVGDTDNAAITNKVAGAEAFTTYVGNDVTLRLAYTTAAAAAIGTAYLASITDAATLLSASSTAALAALSPSLITAGQAVGSTVSLTVGQDTLVGTAANDTFNTFAVDSTGAVVTTVAAYDSINGNGGTDTLNWTATSVAAVSGGLGAFIANGSLVGSVTDVALINIVGSDLISGTPAAGGAAAQGNIDASFFGGATQITVDGDATSVNNVAAGEKIIFTGTTAFDAAGVAIATPGIVNDFVNYGSSVTSGAIAVSNASGSITVTGAKLATLAVTGSTHATSGTPDVLTIVDGSATSTIKTLTIGVTDASEIDITSLAKLTTIDASASTGDLTLDGISSTVSSITTGTGDSVVELSTAFSSSVTTATVTAGAGDDTITVDTSNTGTFTVTAGAGDDTIVLLDTLVAGDKIDGGDGTDTVVLNNTTLATGDYILIAADITNVETVEFSAGVIGVDGSKLTQFTTLAFDGVSTVTKASEALIAHSDLTATAVGYSTPAAGTVYGTGALSVTADVTAHTITVNGASATVTVAADGHLGGTDVGTTIAGDVETLKVVTTNGADSATAPTTDYLTSASITISDATHLAALTAITLTGNGSVTIDASATGGSLATIDASALGGTLANDTGAGSAGDITGGLTLTGSSDVAETITLGSGHDVLTLTSTYATMDTITGFDAVKETADGTSTTDSLTLSNGTSTIVIDGSSATTVVKMTLATGDTTLDLALAHAATVAGADAAGTVIQFVYGGNTYLFADSTATPHATLEATDYVVKLTGTVDLTTAFGTHV